MPRITDLTSALLHSEGSNNFNLRIIQYIDRDNKPQRKFGLSEFWWCEKTQRWYPSKTHHVFLPISVWPKLIALNPLIEQFADGNSGTHDSGASSAPDEPANTEREQRRRGRPPKRANECADTPEGVRAESAESTAEAKKGYNGEASTKATEGVDPAVAEGRLYGNI